jgi:hypothetical protein
LFILVAAAPLPLFAQGVAPCVARNLARKTQALPQLKAKDFGVALIKGGVPHQPVRNQKWAEWCWAEVFNSMGKGKGVSSPAYSAFYNVTLSIQDHLAYFRKVARELEGAATKKERLLLQEQKVNEVIQLLKRKHPPGFKTPTLWTPNIGNLMQVALRQAETIGMLPESHFPVEISTEAQEDAFEKALSNYVLNNLFNNAKLDQIKAAAPRRAQVNPVLYEDLARAVSPILKGIPPLPNQLFQYDGKLYTPLTYMREVMKLNPADYNDVYVTEKNLPLGLRAIKKALKNGQSVPLSFVIFGDLGADGKTMEEIAKKHGIFSNLYCPDGRCVKFADGHGVLIVNALVDKKGNITAFIVKNSWGDKGGLNVNGAPAKNDDEAGYFIITVDYLKQMQTNGHRQPWDVTLPRTITQLPSFSALSPVRP